MTNIKQIIVTITQMVGLALLLASLSGYGFGVLFGPDMVHMIRLVIEFGVALIAGIGAIAGLYIKDDRPRILRDTQAQVGSYIVRLGAFQLLMFVITHGLVGFASGVPSQIVNVLNPVIIFGFCMYAIMSPFTYLQHIFHLLKAKEITNPSKILRELFK